MAWWSATARQRSKYKLKIENWPHPPEREGLTGGRAVCQNVGPARLSHPDARVPILSRPNIVEGGDLGERQARIGAMKSPNPSEREGIVERPSRLQFSL